MEHESRIDMHEMTERRNRERHIGAIERIIAILENGAPAAQQIAGIRGEIEGWAFPGDPWSEKERARLDAEKAGQER